MAPTSSICGARNRQYSESDEEEMKINDVTSKIGKYCRFGPLVVILVGLPACGKTILAHKLDHYFNWVNKRSKVFNVSLYRRKHVDYNGYNLFISDNKNYSEIRKLSMSEAQKDATEFLISGGDVAVLDGTYGTYKIRQDAYNYFSKEMGFKVLFVECICVDKELVENNVKEILQFSMDYNKMSPSEALNDLHKKIEYHRGQFEEIDTKYEAHYSYIKLFNAGKSLSIHQIEGPRQREVLNFVTSFVPARKTYYFSRHGESEFNMLGKIGGDANLSPRGRLYAASLARYFNEADIPGIHIWTSQKKRTKETVQDIKAPMEHISALDELDAGVCEGLSYEEMEEKYPQEFAWRDQDKLRYRYPWGESYADIMNRLGPVLMELENENNLLVVSHQAVLRCILGYFLNKRSEELPYINVPLHTIIKLTTYGYKYKMEIIKLNVECVDTYRQQPKNCSIKQSVNEALPTVPLHCDSLKNNWASSVKLIEQH